MKLDSLNEMQKKAVVKTDGPLLVLAGAGSGKTKVLTTKIAYLIEQMHINPYNILAITFTNKAAREMKDRITNMLGMLANSIQISTFHSFGLTIVRENAEKLDLKSNFTILDSEDSLTIIKKIMKDLNINAESVKPKYVKNQISGAKNELMSPLEYERFAMTEQEKNVVEIYKVYQKRLLISNSVDFDDLLMMPIMLFRKNPDILERYQERFKYILIDEYQDTNEAQYTLVKMISSKYKNVCVVGDNDQSIYSFRGANYQNILNFEKDYKSAETIMLEENYRSTKNILKVANEVIVNNNKRKDKNLWTENEVGNKVKYYSDTINKSISYGNEIGNHSYNHKSLNHLSKEDFLYQLNTTQNIIYEVSGYTPKYLRPTYGNVSKSLREYTPLEIVLWNVDPEDWKYKNSKTIAKRVLNKVKDESVVLMHDTKERTLNALKIIIPELKKQGYQLVTISELKEVQEIRKKTGYN